jgi:predicted transcriptional regulator
MPQDGDKWPGRNESFLGPTQKELLELVRKYPQASLNELISRVESDSSTLPRDRKTIRTTLKALEEKGLIFSKRDEVTELIHFYPAIKGDGFG